MRTRFFVVLILASLAVLPGCKKSTPTDSKTTAGAATTTGTKVVAKVNGEEVKDNELQLALHNLEQQAGGPVPAEQKATVQRQVLDRIVAFRLLVQEARTRKVAAAPWDVDKRIAEVKGQFPNEQAFKDMLKQRNMTEEALRQDTVETLAVNTMLEKEYESLPVATDADTKQFYDGNKPRFQEPASVRASHVLIRVEQNATPDAKAAAKAQIDSILAQLKKGADFAALAKQHSQDPGSAANGGDLGFFAKGQMVPAFEEAAFSTKVGQMTGVVETPFGFHIIKVSGTKPARVVGYDEVKDQIRQYLRQQAQEQKTQTIVEGLKAKAKIEVLL